MTEPLNHHAALVYVMVTVSAVDRTMTDDELARIGEIVSNLPVFADYHRTLWSRPPRTVARSSAPMVDCSRC